MFNELVNKKRVLTVCVKHVYSVSYSILILSASLKCVKRLKNTFLANV